MSQTLSGDNCASPIDPSLLVASGRRRTQEEVAYFRRAIYQAVREVQPCTVRQTFYRLVAKGLPKTQGEYRRVQQELVSMRRGIVAPTVPWGWIVDGTRWMRKSSSWGGLSEVLDDTLRLYRRDLWRGAPVYCEVWLEKDALAGVVHPVTDQFDVPVMVARGFSSVTFLWEAAANIRGLKKPAVIYTFTDWDQSGRSIAETIERDLRRFAPGAEIRCTRAAVTPEQIEELGLPTRPAKRKGGPPAVDLDAIEPDTLRQMVRACIEELVDADHLARVKRAEHEERQSLRTLLGGLR